MEGRHSRPREEQKQRHIVRKKCCEKNRKQQFSVLGA